MTSPEAAAAPTDPVACSGNYLAAIRNGQDTTPYRRRLAEFTVETLADRLAGNGTIAFWCNVYNAAVQDRLTRDPAALDRKWQFFSKNWVTVAGRDVSLNFIEHRLLRRSQSVVGLGYVSVPFPDQFERQLRVEELDPRIHFALNCGAASCPPIRGYQPASLDADLAEATRTYLDGTVEYTPGGLVYDGRVRVPRLFLWYRGDWGGKRGILEFLREYDQVPAAVWPRLSHRPYDWSVRIGEYVD